MIIPIEALLPLSSALLSLLYGINAVLQIPRYFLSGGITVDTKTCPSGAYAGYKAGVAITDASYFIVAALNAAKTPDLPPFNYLFASTDASVVTQVLNAALDSIEYEEGPAISVYCRDWSGECTDYKGTKSMPAFGSTTGYQANTPGRALILLCPKGLTYSRGPAPCSGPDMLVYTIGYLLLHEACPTMHTARRPAMLCLPQVEAYKHPTQIRTLYLDKWSVPSTLYTDMNILGAWQLGLGEDPYKGKPCVTQRYPSIVGAQSVIGRDDISERALRDHSTWGVTKVYVGQEMVIDSCSVLTGTIQMHPNTNVVLDVPL
ncbi:MAG: hypothetical protein M1835_005059 [Candelina submexicana]|nr:MAG: hypothetical protein M1835_005059 [Candelina submexicana]